MSTDASLTDRCSGADAAAIVGIPYPNSFNRTRRLMQRVWNPITGGCEPYPDLPTRADERAFNRTVVLVISEWGGHSYYGSDWTYSRAACIAWAGGELPAGNGEAKQAPARRKHGRRDDRGGSAVGSA